MINLGVLVSGRGSNLQALIDAMEAESLKASISVVISDNPEALALARAERHGIRSEVVKKEDFPSKVAFDAELVRILRERDVGLVALAGFMRLLTPAFIDAFPMRVINIHPSLLPSFPGLDVQRKAVEYGVRFSGCTVHFVDKGVDTGPIIMQAVVPVTDTDTAETLAERILREEHRIYPQAVRLFAEDRLRVEGRRVIVKDHPGIDESTSMENPAVTET